MPRKKPGSGSLTPIMLIAAGAILIIASAAWFVLSSGALAQPAPTATRDIPYPEIPRVSVKDSRAAFELGNAVFIDTRGEPFYSEGHIPGAISMTSDEVVDRLDELDPASWIITYCT